MNIRMVAMLSLAFGLLLLGITTFAVAEPAGPLTVATLQAWGWVFSAMGLAMMNIRVPPHIAKIWALAIIILIAYVIGVSQGWIT